MESRITNQWFCCPRWSHGTEVCTELKIQFALTWYLSAANESLAERITAVSQQQTNPRLWKWFSSLPSCMMALTLMTCPRLASTLMTLPCWTSCDTLRGRDHWKTLLYRPWLRAITWHQRTLEYPLMRSSTKSSTQWITRCRLTNKWLNRIPWKSNPCKKEV